MASKYAIETVFNLIDKVSKPVQQIDSRMGKLGTTSNHVNAALKRGFADAEKSLGKFTAGVKKAVVGLQAAGVAAAGAFAANGVKNAIEYEQSLAKLSTIANDLPMDETSQKILKVSNTMHIAATDITESTYNAISSGIEATKAVDFVATATKAAKAGFAETGVAIDGLTNIMNAYGMSADNAMKIADQMLVTQNLGKATFTDMAKGMGQVAPLASSLNVKTEELFASIAALTNAGIQTPQAITGIKAALSNIMKPTTQASKLAEQLGLDFSAAGLQSKGWVGFLEDIKTATKGDAAMMATLFGSVEALNSISVLTGKGAGKLTETLEAMTSMAGITEKAFDRMMKTPQERLAGLKNQFTNAGIKLGQALLPVLEKVADKIEVFINKFDNVDFSGVTKIVDKVADAFINLLDILWALKSPAGFVLKTFSLVTNGIAFALQKIAALRGAFIALAYAISIVKAATSIYKAMMIAAVVASKTWTAVTTAARVAQLAYAIAIKGSSGAMIAFGMETKGVQIATLALSKVMRGVAWVASMAKTLAYKAALLATSAATKIVTAAQWAWHYALVAGGWIKATAGIIAQKVATLALAAAQGVATGATGALSVATGVLNALFIASPIGWVVLAIGALIAIIILCVKHWDKITAAVGIAWEKLKQFGSFILGKLTPILDTLWQPIKRIIDAFTDGGIVGGIRQIGASILKFLLTPVLTIMDGLAKIPVIGDKIGNAKEWLENKIDDIGYTQKIPEVEGRVIPFPVTSDGDTDNNNQFAPAPSAFTPYAAAQVNTQHTEINRSEMQISLEKGLQAHVYGKAPGVTVQTQKTGTFD